MSLPGQHALCRAGVVCLHLLVAGAQHILRGVLSLFPRNFLFQRLMLRVLISSLTTVPHSLTAGALGLLLVFRTNTAYDRFWEVRLPPPLVPATFLHLLRSHFLKDIVLHVKSPTKRVFLLAECVYMCACLPLSTGSQAVGSVGELHPRHRSHCARPPYRIREVCEQLRSILLRDSE